MVPSLTDEPRINIKIVIYIGVFDQNWIIKFYILIVCPIVPPSKLYEYNQATIKILLAYRITPQARPKGFLITALHELCLLKTSEMVDTRSNIQLAELNSKPQGHPSVTY